MSDQASSLESVLQSMRMPASLARHAPTSATRALRTLPLREFAQAQGIAAEFDDSCLLTLPVDMSPSQLPFKLSLPGPRKQFSGVHLTSLSARGQINLTLGDDHSKVFVGSDTQVRCGVQLFRRPTLFIGDGTTIGQSRLIVNNADLIIGEDCQFVEDVLVQCNDGQALIDLDSGKVLNGERRRTYLGRHVLVQRRATLMPGVRIGDGSIVQAGALVVLDVPANTLVGGVPASPLRERVAWERDFKRVGNPEIAGIG
jgi:acetyltransferase-like isoleucine patch superfamily enzyme